jgi:hypothetical protein
VKLGNKTGTSVCNQPDFAFLYIIYAFRSRKVVVSFPPPKKQIFSADIKGERLYGFEVMDFGYSSCG